MDNDHNDLGPSKRFLRREVDRKGKVSPNNLFRCGRRYPEGVNGSLLRYALWSMVADGELRFTKRMNIKHAKKGCS